MFHLPSSMRRVALLAIAGGAIASLTTAMPAGAVDPPASVTSTATDGIRFTGTNAKDQVVLSRAGTATDPRVVLDTAAPLTVGTDCQSVPGDPTRAVCKAPLFSGTTVKSVRLNGLGGDDIFAHGVSAPIPMVVIGGDGNDTVNAGPGRDSLYGGKGNDTLRGGDSTDFLSGEADNDVLDGGPGIDDELFGGPGTDTLLGGPGNSDDLTGGPGPDTFDGGTGLDDIVLYDERSKRVVIDLSSTGPTNGEISEGDMFKTGIENAVGGHGNDFLAGNAEDNNLIGGDGIDTILGGLGQDGVIGQDGNDVLSGNTVSIAGDFVNSDGDTDFIGGGDGADTCIRSTQDPDSVNECETVLVDN